MPVLSNPTLLEMVPADGANVAAIPFTVLVNVLPERAVKELVPTMVASVVAATPFMVVLTVFTVGLETMVVFIIGTLAPVTLFTVVVMPFSIEALETVVPLASKAATVLCSSTPVVVFVSTTLSFAKVPVFSPNNARVLVPVVVIWLGEVNTPPNAILPLEAVNPLFAEIRTDTAGVVVTPLT